MTNAIALRDNTPKDVVPEGYEPIVLKPPAERLPSPSQFSMMMQIAQMAVTGANNAVQAERALPVAIKTPEQAMTIMLAGYELGLPPFSALRRLYIVNGRVELETQALMGLVKAGDPTAHFRFTDYTRDRVEVELYRQGELMIRVDYTREDAIAAGQLKDVWYRKNTNDGGNRVAMTVDSSYVFKAGEKRGGKVGNTDKYYVLEQGKSVWTQFTRDMLAYSAVKRACRLGAPELTNQILPLPPAADAYELTATARAVGDAIGAPANPVSAALIEGRVAPAAVFGSEASTEPDPTPEEPTPAQHAAQAQRRAPAPRQAAQQAPDAAGKADPRNVARIEARLREIRDTTDPAYYRSIYKRVVDECLGGGRFAGGKFTVATAAAAWEMIKPEEPPAPDQTPNVEPEDDDEPEADAQEGEGAEFGPDDDEDEGEAGDDLADEEAVE